jgi:hypothetical protein
MARAEMFQDNQRESQIAAFLGLTPSEHRAGQDATDSAGNAFELKSVSNSQVTTGRDVGVHTINKWRKVYWVVAVGTQDQNKKLQVTALFVAHPKQLESWFGSLEALLKGEERRYTQVLRAAKRGGAIEQDIEFVRQKCERGITRNNPKIPLQLFREYGLAFDHQNATAARRQLAQFVQQHPLPRIEG